VVVAQVAWLWGSTKHELCSNRENTDGAVWTPTGEDYDEFLWHFVVEAVLGGDIGAGANNVDAAGFRSWRRHRIELVHDGGPIDWRQPIRLTQIDDLHKASFLHRMSRTSHLLGETRENRESHRGAMTPST
jgi:hypothetical protein